MGPKFRKRRLHAIEAQPWPNQYLVQKIGPDHWELLGMWRHELEGLPDFPTFGEICALRVTKSWMRDSECGIGEVGT